jgi:hypothetical protein
MMYDGSNRDPEASYGRCNLQNAEYWTKCVDNQSFSNSMDGKPYKNQGFQLASTSKDVQ